MNQCLLRPVHFVEHTMEKKRNDPTDLSRPASDTPIYESVVRLWRAHGRTLPRQARPNRPARGWVRVDRS